MLHRVLRVLVLVALTMALPLPTSAQAASASPVEELIAQCPPAEDVAAFNADLTITFEGVDPSGDTRVCHASDGSADLTRWQERTYQALRVMKVIRFSRALPWTSQNLYDWFVSSIQGIRFRGDITGSFCCEPANVINIQAAPNSTALATNRWIDPASSVGLDDLLALLVHEARHNNGKPHTCVGTTGDQTEDQTIDELGAWGVEYYLELWEGLYSGAFLTSPDIYPSYYRDHHLLTSESTYLSRICDVPDADLALAIGAPSPNPAVRGQNVSYTFTATNSGPDTASDVFIYSPVPVGTTFVGATTSQGSCTADAGGPIACTLGSIASGAAAAANVTLLVDPSSTVTPITNKESPTALGAWVTGPDRDTVPANNSASFSTPVTDQPPVLGPLDHITVSPATTSVSAGTPVTYAVTGYDTAGHSLGPVSDATLAIAPDGVCTGLTCTATIAGAHTVTATATADAVTVTAAAALTVTAGPPSAVLGISGDGQSVRAGQTFSQPLEVRVVDAYSNPVDAAPVTFTIASGATFTGGGTTMTAATAADGTATSATIVAGATTGPITVAATTGTAAPTNFTLTIAESTTTRADLAVTLTAPTSVTTGTAFAVTLRITNNGPSAATKTLGAINIPRGMTVTNTGGGTQIKGAVVFKAGTLTSGRTVTYTVQMKAARSLRGTTVTFYGGGLSATRDPALSNNKARATVHVS